MSRNIIRPENHTAEVLAEVLTEVVHDWDIEESKMSCVTTDNGASIVAAIRGLKWPWLNCFGHNLNVAVNYSQQKEKARTDCAFETKAQFILLRRTYAVASTP